jgi:DNA modification methylase
VVEPDVVLQGDSIAIMENMPAESIGLIFADPPFNIGIKYRNYKDTMVDEEYLSWSRRWIAAAVRLLTPTGSLYIAIGDEYAADLRVILRDFPVYFRNWIIWYYTFGQNAKMKFNRSHTHILYFVKDPARFTFNADAVRIPSARQLVYKDRRANKKGKIPDDVWTFSRICGTFKERLGDHPCQMPELLLERIIKVSSNPGDLVLDPFAGTGTTLAVAKRLDRHFIGLELSDEYCQAIVLRLKRQESAGIQLSLPLDAAVAGFDEK